MYKFNYYLVVESNNIKRVFINFFSIKLIYILLIGIIYIYIYIYILFLRKMRNLI